MCAWRVLARVLRPIYYCVCLMCAYVLPRELVCLYACVCVCMHVSSYLCSYPCSRALRRLLPSQGSPLSRCSISRCRRLLGPSLGTVWPRATKSSRFCRRICLVPSRTSSKTHRQSRSCMPIGTLGFQYTTIG